MNELSVYLERFKEVWERLDYLKCYHDDVVFGLADRDFDILKKDIEIALNKAYEDGRK